MKPEYWLERWGKGATRFHLATPNPRLVQYHPRVLGDVLRVLVPLCGKSVDLEWLAVRGHEVVGIELSELAAQAFFAERKLEPETCVRGDFLELKHGAVSILVGDFFAATPELTGYCDGVYDRAALIALPAELRARYAAHLPCLLAPKAKQLLVTLDFDAEGGPPFAVTPREVMHLYAGTRISELACDDARADSPGPVERGASYVNERSYLVEFP